MVTFRNKRKVPEQKKVCETVFWRFYAIGNNEMRLRLNGKCPNFFGLFSTWLNRSLQYPVSRTFLWWNRNCCLRTDRKTGDGEVRRSFCAYTEGVSECTKALTSVSELLASLIQFRLKYQSWCSFFKVF